MTIVSGTFPLRYRLPVAYSTEIGRIMTRWAFIEWQLEQITYRVVGVGPKIGRLTIRDPRVDAHITMIADVMKLRKISVRTDLAKLSSGLVQIKNFRDAVAHGIWITHPISKLPLLQYTKGKWSIAAMPNTKRVVEPEGVPVTIEKLRAFVLSIEGAARTISKLEREIAAQLSASPQK
jgi:hypothetical protein